MSDGVSDINTFPVHLGLGGRVEKIDDPFDGTPDWYMRYGMNHAADGDDGRLVSFFTFTESWDSWEMHPHGDELVLCTSGTMTLHQEFGGAQSTVVLHAGEYAINRPGTWHIADIDGAASGVFITSGRGTEVRPRT
jgi:mannose-6-phosphate isomerase-like protein (cupin superfamily)